jgi:hypothetical protein
MKKDIDERLLNPNCLLLAKIIVGGKIMPATPS